MLRAVLARTAIVACVLACCGAAAADAAVLRPERDAFLRAGPLGQAPFGTGVAGVGDVNGDGLTDVAVVQEEPGDPIRRSVLVVLGRRDRATVDHTAPEPAGFRITDPPDQVPSDSRGGLVSAFAVGASVAGAGDVNGDGLADIAVGIAEVGNSLRRESGSVFVVFGSRDPRSVRLDDLGERGFRIDGARAQAGVGGSVAGLGDVDGDGLGDLAIGGDGSAYVVFGRRSSALVDLRSPGDRASALRHPARGFEENPHVVASAGDANGDGRGDLVVATSGFLDGDVVREERVWVVFGRPGTALLDLRRLGSAGYEVTGTRIDGPEPGTLGSAGDVNGDGRGDLALSKGLRTWVVPGRVGSGPVDVRTARDVLTLRTGHEDASVAGVGDVNGDRRADLAVGTASVSGDCRSGAGAISIVYGRRAGELDLRRLRPADGFRLLGDDTGAGLGSAIAGAGDVDGDGRPDLAFDLTPGPLDTLGSEPPQQRELGVVPVAATPEADAPRRGRCLTVRALTPTLARARAERRIRVRVRALEFQRLVVSAEIVRCRRGSCTLEPLEGWPDQLVAVEAGSRLDLTFRLGPKTLRALRAPSVRGVLVCANDSSCDELTPGR